MLLTKLEIAAVVCLMRDDVMINPRWDNGGSAWVGGYWSSDLWPKCANPHTLPGVIASLSKKGVVFTDGFSLCREAPVGRCCHPDVASKGESPTR